MQYKLARNADEVREDNHNGHEATTISCSTRFDEHSRVWVPRVGAGASRYHLDWCEVYDEVTGVLLVGPTPLAPYCSYALAPAGGLTEEKCVSTKDALMAEPTVRFVLWENSNGQGVAVAFRDTACRRGAGMNVPRSFNDEASSVDNVCNETKLCRDSNGKGGCIFITGRGLHNIPRDFNDVTSSAYVD